MRPTGPGFGTPTVTLLSRWKSTPSFLQGKSGADHPAVGIERWLEDACVAGVARLSRSLSSNPSLVADGNAPITLFPKCVSPIDLAKDD